jgi:hypothetical protein
MTSNPVDFLLRFFYPYINHPIGEKLKKCLVFGVRSDEYLNHVHKFYGICEGCVVSRCLLIFMVS